jgi:hypothetical protein
MAIIDDIRAKIVRGQFEFTQHAVDQSIVRHISLQELREAIAVGEVIEDYPTDKYGPSCSIFGFTLAVPLCISNAATPRVLWRSSLPYMNPTRDAG